VTGRVRADRGDRPRLPPAQDGLLIVDKPAGWTSHDVVARSRGICRTRKIGHAGTLDPMATGVLVLGVGRATRLLTHLVGCDKTYTATIRLGQSTVTDDGEGEVTSSRDAGGITRAAIDAAVATLTGDILQRPSAVSAIKVAGQRSYARVRAGEDVELPARPVTVSDFDVVSVNPVDLGEPGEAGESGENGEQGEHGQTQAHGIQVLDVDVVVSVSSGTYVRALARDLGEALGVGGHLTALRRTRVGRFTLADAYPLQSLMNAAETGADAPVIPLAEAAAAAFPVRRVTDQETQALGHGQRIPRVGPARTGVVAALSDDGRLIALLDESGETARTAVVFAPAGS